MEQLYHIVINYGCYIKEQQQKHIKWEEKQPINMMLDITSDVVSTLKIVHTHCCDHVEIEPFISECCLQISCEI